MVDYSVVIRTTGQAGEKYQRLLDSVAQLCPQPREIIVVLPEGYSKPNEQLGWETFYYSRKGMVTQRMFGIEQCNSRYALICDDDVCFGSDFVEQLYEPIRNGVAKISAGPLLTYLPKPGLQSFFYAITGAAVPKVRRREEYISILPTTGYAYNRKIDSQKCTYMQAQSLPWTCFFGEVAAIKDIRMEDELWLERDGYASMDDQTMFYKAFLLGIKTVIVPGAFYQHLDAMTSRKVSSETAYAMEFNRYVFWYRFIFSVDGEKHKVRNQLAISYYFFWKKLYNLFRLAIGKLDKQDFKIKMCAVGDAKKYVVSDEYLAFPTIQKSKDLQ